MNQLNYTIQCVSDSGISESALMSIIAIFNATSGPFKINLIKEQFDVVLDDFGDMLWAQNFIKLRDLRDTLHIDKNDFICYLTHHPNEANFYAASDSFFDFEKAFLDPLNTSCPSNFFVHFENIGSLNSTSKVVIAIHFIIKFVLKAMIESSFPEKSNIFKKYCHHTETKGCLFDFCQKKSDFQFKFRSAYICGDCLEVCEKIPHAEEVITQVVDLLECCRLESLPTNKYLKRYTPHFNLWPFPIAVTRHLYERSENSAFKLFRLLDHFDNLVRYTVITETLWNDKDLNILEKPSLGYWVSCLRNLGSVEGIDLISDAAKIADKEKVVHFRNEYKGHGYILRDTNEYNEPLIQLESAVEKIESILLNLYMDKSLVYIDSVELNESSLYVLSGDLLQGSNHLFSRWTQTINTDPRVIGILKNKIMLTNKKMDKKFINLTPYLIKTVCSHCQMNHILINDGDHYIDLQQGHRTKLKR